MIRHTIDILRNSKYAIPVIQSFHLFGITLLLGSMVILNLRLSGMGLRAIADGGAGESRFGAGLIGGLLLAMLTGFLVFMPDPGALRCESCVSHKNGGIVRRRHVSILHFS